LAPAPPITGTPCVRFRCTPNEHPLKAWIFRSATGKAAPFAITVAELILPLASPSQTASVSGWFMPKSSALTMTATEPAAGLRTEREDVSWEEGVEFVGETMSGGETGPQQNSIQDAGAGSHRRVV
jgi:hypothetical protein